MATALNTLLASPTFEAWRMGSPLDVEQWIAPREDGRTPALIVSVAHLDDAERSLVLGLAAASGESAHQEAARFVMKQARALGWGVSVATQNPMDSDYRALSNAGVWFVGRSERRSAWSSGRVR